MLLRRATRRTFGIIALLLEAVIACAQSGPPLQLAKTIPLPEIKERIDHLAFDVDTQCLFVAALGNEYCRGH
jgi:phage tail protein X